MKTLIALFFLTISSSLFAKASYKLFIDCATTDHYFKCFEIRETLKLKLLNGDQVVSSLEESTTSLKIRTREVDEAAITYIHVELFYQHKGDETPFLMNEIKYAESQVNVTTTTDLVNHIVVHLASTRGILSLDQTDKGVVVVLGNSDGTGSGGGNSQVKDWYLEPSGSVSWNDSVNCCFRSVANWPKQWTAECLTFGFG